MHNCKLLGEITSVPPSSSGQLYSNLLATVPNGVFCTRCMRLYAGLANYFLC